MYVETFDTRQGSRLGEDGEVILSCPGGMEPMTMVVRASALPTELPRQPSCLSYNPRQDKATHHTTRLTNR